MLVGMSQATLNLRSDGRFLIIPPLILSSVVFHSDGSTLKTERRTRKSSGGGRGCTNLLGAFGVLCVQGSFVGDFTFGAFSLDCMLGFPHSHT